jgi:hypothetical protein
MFKQEKHEIKHGFKREGVYGVYGVYTVYKKWAGFGVALFFYSTENFLP